MNFSYVDQSGKNLSKLVRVLVKLSRSLPSVLHESIMWRISKYFAKALHVQAYKENPGFVKWGCNVTTIGNGRIHFLGSFAIGNNSYFEIQENCCVEMADGVRLDTGVALYAYRGNMHIGPRVYIGPYSFLQSESDISIGPDSMIGPHAKIVAYTRTAVQSTLPYAEQAVTGKGIRIGGNVWIGAGVTILDGVHIGDNAIVGAGAVVTKNVAPGVVVAGVPATFIRNV